MDPRHLKNSNGKMKRQWIAFVVFGKGISIIIRNSYPTLVPWALGLQLYSAALLKLNSFSDIFQGFWPKIQNDWRAERLLGNAYF